MSSNALADLAPAPINVALRFELPGLAPEEFGALLELLFNLCRQHVELPAGAIDLVVIADEAQFGPTVYELQDAAGQRREYTDRGLNLAVGKTIPFRLTPETVTSRVVLLTNIVFEALTPILAGRAPHEWQVSEQTCFSIICHEWGHGKDNRIRRADDDPQLFEGPFRIGEYADYYGSIMMGEVAACALSAGAMTEAVYDLEATQWRELAEQALAAVTAVRIAYQGGAAAKLGQLQTHAAHAFWTICVQYAKLIASAAANPALPQSEPEMWAGAPAGARAALADLAAQVRRMWAAYPNWNEEFSAAFFRAWDALAQTHGYEFYGAVAEDGLHLR